MLKLPKLQTVIDWLESAQTPLREVAKTCVLSTDLQIGKKADFEVAGGTLSAAVGVSGAFKVFVFNDAKDLDSERVIGELKDDARTIAGVDWRPQIDVQDGEIRTAYQATFSIKAGISAKVGLAAGGINGDRELVLSSYCRQADKGSALIDAVRADLIDGLPSILDFQETQGLASGSAVAMRIGGKLTASLTLSWAEVFASSLGSLTRVLGAKTPLQLEFSAGAKLTASVVVQDDFQLAIVRDDNGYKIAVRKLAQRTSGLGVTVGIEIALSQASQAYLLGVAKQLLDQVFARASSVLEKLAALDPATLLSDAIAGLPTELKPFALQVMESLGIAPAAPIAKLNKRLESKIQELQEKVKELVTAQLKASFAFSYQRIATDGSILEVRMPALDALTHGQLVALDVSAFLARIQAGSVTASVERYMHQTTIERKRTVGFSIGLGKWLSAESLTTRQVREVKQTDVDGNIKIAQLGLLKYKDTWQGTTRSWTATLKADAAVFRKSPLREDFALGFHLLVDSDIDERAKLEDVFETAHLLGVFDAPGKASAQASLRGAEVVSAQVSLSLEGASFDQVIRSLTTLTSAEFGHAVAAGMGLWPTVSARKDLTVRKAVYGPVWAGIVRDGYSLSANAQSFRKALRAAGFDNQDQLKEGPARIDAVGQLRPRSATRIAHDHPLLPERFENLKDAVNSILSTNGDYAKALDNAFEKLFLRKTVFQNMLTLRAIAYLLSRRANRLVGFSDGYQATMTVTLASDAQIVFGQH